MLCVFVSLSVIWPVLSDMCMSSLSASNMGGVWCSDGKHFCSASTDQCCGGSSGSPWCCPKTADLGDPVTCGPNAMTPCVQKKTDIGQAASSSGTVKCKSDVKKSCPSNSQCCGKAFDVWCCPKSSAANPVICGQSQSKGCITTKHPGSHLRQDGKPCGPSFLRLMCPTSYTCCGSGSSYWCCNEGSTKCATNHQYKCISAFQQECAAQSTSTCYSCQNVGQCCGSTCCSFGQKCVSGQCKSGIDQLFA
eukprot:TRINITY_DN103693_c0_g1_i1.p1 TRINITY_DN103693_c0_g1~~TRINITY_DN103693_c0_g1_i1.p1  ORF type:complete len:249 (+),score=15.57 TRINITY_DN103693_c0_g1_i1:76-822(+)